MWLITVSLFRKNQFILQAASFCDFSIPGNFKGITPANIYSYFCFFSCSRLFFGGSVLRRNIPWVIREMLLSLFIYLFICFSQGRVCWHHKDDEQEKTGVLDQFQLSCSCKK